MTKTMLVSTLLALLCAGTMTATAAPSQNADVPAAQAARVAHQNFAECAPLCRNRRPFFRQDGHNAIPTTFTKRTG
jgi:hypothetical protein